MKPPRPLMRVRSRTQVLAIAAPRPCAASSLARLVATLHGPAMPNSRRDNQAARAPAASGGHREGCPSVAAARSGPARWTDVGRFVGLFCQPGSGSWRFIAVDSLTTESAGSPVATGLSCKTLDAGAGTRTPDTRTMIPRVES
jgi:hypothetical protein